MSDHPESESASQRSTSNDDTDMAEFLSASNYSLANSITASVPIRSRSLSPFEVPAADVEAIPLPPDVALSSPPSPLKEPTNENEANDLMEATSGNPTAVMELDMDGNVRFLSKSWESIVGTRIKKILNKPVSELVIAESDLDKNVFTRAIQIMSSEDTSYRVKFITSTNETVPNYSSPDEDELPTDVVKNEWDLTQEQNLSSAASTNSEISTDGGFIEMEGQGILIHDLKTHLPTHSMWILRPFVPIAVTLELPDELVDKLGSGIDIFESYLISLNEAGIIDMDAVPAPRHVLCRVCEQQVPAWWLERHSEACLVEHRIEDTVRACHESLIEHKKVLISLMEALTHSVAASPTLQVASLSPLSSNNSSSSASSSTASSPTSPTSPSSFSHQNRQKSAVEYKGLQLPLPRAITSSVPVNSSPLSSNPPSPVSTPQTVRKSSSSILGNIRFPLKNLERLIQFCSDAISINSGELIHRNGQKIADVAYSPNSERAMKSIITATLPDSSDPAIKLLTDDTLALAREKVDAIKRLSSSLQYSEKLKTEIDALVLQAVTGTINKIREKTIGSTSYSNTNERGDDIFTDAYIGTDELPSTPSADFRNLTTSPFSKSALLTDTHTGSETPRIQIDNEMTHSSSNSNDSQLATPEVQVDNRGRRSMFQQNRNTYQSPRRPVSPAPAYFSNSPMASLQRNTRPHKESVVSSSTPTSSPLLTPNEMPIQSLMQRSFYHSNSISTWDSNVSDRHSSTDSNILAPLSSSASKPPLSPLLVSGSVTSKQKAPSIKDYEIIKPISKGAFGSVFLTRRRLTGEYFAIKVLKKSDMIAKNQVPNVKAERAIMMRQADSPYVAQLYSSFQSKEYLFLVMEYLNGGDTASLLKMLGTLSNEWARRYIAEVIVGVDDLHKKGIVHRDLKPDNLLIDNYGHLKLTDFGLSRMGLIGRQKNLRRDSAGDGHPIVDGLPLSSSVLASVNRHHKRTSSITPFSLSPNLERASLSSSSKPIQDFSMSPSSPPSGSFFEHLIKGESTRRSSSNASSNDSPMIRPLIPRSSSQTSFAILDDVADTSATPSGEEIASRNSLALFDPQTSTQARKFVGTPDYLAPETIQGIGQDEVSDWWSIGCILFEFLFGYPPFHDSTPERVFERILKNDVDWPDLPEKEFKAICPDDGKDLISKLLIKDPQNRLGANGTDEIKRHPYFKGIVWETLFEEEASFIPVVDDPESTEYFDPRGADIAVFPRTEDDDDLDLELHGEDDEDDTDYDPDNSDCLDFSNATKISSPQLVTGGGSPGANVSALSISTTARERRRSSKLNENSSSEFGSFQFRNLSALDRANKDAINRLKTEHAEHRGSFSMSSSSTESAPTRARGYSASNVPFKRPTSPSLLGTPSRSSFSAQNAAFPSRQSSSVAGSNSGDDNSSTPALNASSGRNSPLASAYQSRSTDSGSPVPKIVRSSARGSMSLQQQAQSPQYPAFKALGNSFADFSPSSSDNEESRNSAIMRVRKRRSSRRLDSASSENSEQVRRPMITYDVLYCEPIPILRESVKLMLQKLGCVVVSIKDGDELVRRATGQIKFDFIVTALRTPKVNAIDVVKLIKNTATVNSDTPIIALTAYYKEASSSGVFDAVLEKPFSQKQLKETLAKFSVEKRNAEAISDTEALA